MIRMLIFNVWIYADHAALAAVATMDSFELFRKLGSGAKFDLKRFAQDAARFKVSLSLNLMVTGTQTIGTRCCLPYADNFSYAPARKLLGFLWHYCVITAAFGHVTVDLTRFTTVCPCRTTTILLSWLIFTGYQVSWSKTSHRSSLCHRLL